MFVFEHIQGRDYDSSFIITDLNEGNVNGRVFPAPVPAATAVQG